MAKSQFLYSPMDNPYKLGLPLLIFNRQFSNVNFLAYLCFVISNN